MNRIKLSLVTLAAAIPLASSLLAGAASPNLIANGAFTNNVAGWDNFSGNPQFDNGTMVVTNDYQGNGNSYYSGWYCAKNVEPGKEYQTTGGYFVPVTAPANTGADLSVFYYASNDCSGGNLVTGGGGNSGGRIPEQRGQWLTFSFKTTAPANAHSARVRATAFKEPKAPQTSIPEVHKVNFDNMYFGEAEKVIVAPQPTATPKGPGDIVADPQPTATPKAPQDIVADPQNPQPTATPKAPNTGDAATGDTADDIESKGGMVDDSGMTGGDTDVAGDTKQDTAGDTSPDVVAAVSDEEGVGFGLALLFIGFGSVFAAIGVGFGAIAKRRRHQD